MLDQDPTVKLIEISGRYSPFTARSREQFARTDRTFERISLVSAELNRALLQTLTHLTIEDRHFRL